MLHSWSNFSREFIYGNTFDFGDFNECVSINQNISGGSVVTGQYCLVQFQSTTNSTVASGPGSSSFYNTQFEKLNERFVGAVCIPSSCSVDTVKLIAEEIFAETGLIVSDYEQSGFCKNANQHREKIDHLSVVAVLLMSFLLSIVVWQTTYDIVLRKKCEKPKESFTTFSLYTNVQNLFATSTNGVQCMDGIKTLSTLAIIGFHTTYHTKFFPAAGPHQVDDWESTLTSYLSFGCHYFVESFFVIGGALAAKSIVRDLKS